ncbi:hypothetical protein GHL04_23530, partial [Salmonella enterica]|nr:hypothetical protein [Salmonella enterica]EBP3987918.1 hypothetical protein [Salmonella enterica subsp. enterica]ECG8614859.1 hypothetical protein [Salmonella enterica subsp. houtenae]EDG3665985.1 hypothetical protein [Salmonella enterica subsp. enterica serovar Give]EDS6967383.1 hypothetical protein [Salmonella enterica subsp. houtenae serovar 44:z4,z23:-]EEC0966096.1 hypothetical protein [Salmonella enterica subsp. enterica serovar Baguida]
MPQCGATLVVITQVKHCDLTVMAVYLRPMNREKLAGILPVILRRDVVKINDSVNRPVLVPCIFFELPAKLTLAQNQCSAKSEIFVFPE